MVRIKLVPGLATDILGSVVEVDEVEEQQADRPAPDAGGAPFPSEVMQVRLVNALEAKDWPF